MKNLYEKVMAATENDKIEKSLTQLRTGSKNTKNNNVTLYKNLLPGGLTL
jgi:hypothetical protein